MRSGIICKTDPEKAGAAKSAQKNITRVEKKLKYQWETIQAAEKADTFRLYGELISANIYQLKRGMDRAVLQNYYRARCAHSAGRLALAGGQRHQVF